MSAVPWGPDRPIPFVPVHPGYPRIAQPKVTVTTVGEKTVGTCTHCVWSYANYAKTDVEGQVRRHRTAHREGTVPGKAVTK